MHLLFPLFHLATVLLRLAAIVLLIANPKLVAELSPFAFITVASLKHWVIEVELGAIIILFSPEFFAAWRARQRDLSAPACSAPADSTFVSSPDDRSHFDFMTPGTSDYIAFHATDKPNTY